jgi:hypothetical protein
VVSTAFEFDEIGQWSELKLEIVEKYGAAYTRAFLNEPRLKKFYIDAFSGAGVHVSKRTGQQVEGRVLCAWDCTIVSHIQPPALSRCWPELYPYDVVQMRDVEEVSLVSINLETGWLRLRTTLGLSNRPVHKNQTK